MIAGTIADWARSQRPAPMNTKRHHREDAGQQAEQRRMRHSGQFVGDAQQRLAGPHRQQSVDRAADRGGGDPQELLAEQLMADGYGLSYQRIAVIELRRLRPDLRCGSSAVRSAATFACAPE
jgi:hypothetical protein